MASGGDAQNLPARRFSTYTNPRGTKLLQLANQSSDIGAIPLKTSTFIHRATKFPEEPRQKSKASRIDMDFRYNSSKESSRLFTQRKYKQGIRIMLLRIFVLVLSTGLIDTSSEADQRTFEGRWNNRKFNSSGTMTCVLDAPSPGRWSGVFRGVFQGDPFEFKTSFQSSGPETTGNVLGKQTIRGAKYQWTGTLRGSVLRGRYRATNGFNGEFVLNETNAKSQKPQQTKRNELEDIEIDPVVHDGQRMLFVGNSFMANEGGVYSYLQLALKKRGIEITYDKKIFYGKPLSEMVTADVGAAMMSEDVDVVVITSGKPKYIKQFATKLKGAGKKLIVLMTWELKHPGNGASMKQYTSATRKAVRAMRRIEKETDATVIPAAVLFHDLTLSPPEGVPRVDYLWKEHNIHQNELGTMVNAWLLTAILTGETPVGLSFDMSPFLVGQKIQSEPGFRLTRDLRQALQYRTWRVAQGWARGKTHLEQ